MMKFIVFTLLIVFIPFHPTIGQTDDPDSKVLAEYSILKYTLEKDQGEWLDSSFLKSNISDLDELVNKKDFQYKVKMIWKYNSYELIAIIDKTNLQLHGLNTSMFIIDNARFLDRYHEIKSETIESFITNEFVRRGISSDSLRNVIIDLYNAVVFFDDTTVYTTTLLIKSKDDPRFQILEEEHVYSQFDLFRFRGVGNEVFQQRVYKYYNNGSDICDYWLIQYNFDNCRFWVTKDLLLRGKGIKGE
jgi:hypothetical protein